MEDPWLDCGFINFEKKIKPMKDIIGTIGNFEYGQYIISTGLSVMLMLDVLNMIMFWL